MPTPVVVRPPPALTGNEIETKGNTHTLDADNDGAAAERYVSFSPSSRAPGSTRSIDTIDHDRVSRTDISASSRLPYYMFCCVAFVCCLVTVLVYDDKHEKILDVIDRFYFEWKHDGTKAVSAAGIGLTGFILLAHLDKVVFPTFWRLTFRDGSRGELAVIVVLVLLCTAGVYLSTTPFSLGEVVHNIYFSSWIALGSSVAALNEWIRGTGNRTPSDYLLDLSSKKSLYWAWLVIFSSVQFASCMELYANRNNDYSYFGVGSLSSIEGSEWNQWLIISSAELGFSVIGLSLNVMHTKPFKISFGCFILDLDWQRWEALVLICYIAINMFSVLKYTGVEGYLNSPNNPYFSLWGLLFTSILALYAWMVEHNMLLLSYTKGKGFRSFYRSASPTSNPPTSTNEASS